MPAAAAYLKLSAEGKIERGLEIEQHTGGIGSH